LKKEIQIKDLLIIKNKADYNNSILSQQNFLKEKYEKVIKEHKDLENWFINEDIKVLSNQNKKLLDEITQIKEHMKDSDLPNKKRKLENII